MIKKTILSLLLFLIIPSIGIAGPYVSGESGSVSLVNAEITGDPTITDTTPTLNLRDSNDAAGTAEIGAGSSGGANDTILSLRTEDSTGENTEYVQIDGVSETVDIIKPLVLTDDVTVGGGNINFGNIAGILGDATTDSVTITTDGTGEGEVELPDDVIGDEEIDWSDVTAVDITMTDAGVITSSGTITSSGIFDVTGAAQLTLGSTDVLSHKLSGISEDLVFTPSADLWTIASTTGALITITPAVTFTSPIADASIADDITASNYAPLASPALTGDPTLTDPTPTFLLQDSTAAAGTAQIGGGSTGAYDVVTSLVTDIAGSPTTFIELDGTDETIDAAYDLTFVNGDVIRTKATDAGHTFAIQVYDNTGASWVPALTFTNGIDGSRAVSLGTGVKFDGLGTLALGGIVLGDTTPDADGEIGYATNAFLGFANSEDFTLTAGTDIWTFASNTGGTFAFTPAVTFTSTISSNGSFPDATDGAALGSTSVMWSDLFLASGGVINWDNGNVTITHSAGTLTTNADLITTADEIRSAGAASPYTGLMDSDAAGAEYTDEETVKIYGQQTTTTEDGEVGDFRIATVGGSAAGTWNTNVWWDASGELLYLGTMTDADAPAAISGSENLNVDFNTATDNEILVATDSGATDIRTALQITDTKKVTADIDNEAMTIAQIGQVWTNTGDGDGTIYTLPEASTWIGKSVAFVVTVAQTLTINPNDGTDIFLYLGCSAGDAIQADAVGETITVMAIDANNIAVFGPLGTWTDVN
jgi:hypothetical protein